MHERQADAFAELASAELPGLRRFAYALVGDWHRADDITQAALERMYVAWPRLRDVADPGAYLRTVAARCAASESRRSWFRRERVVDVMPDQAIPDGAATAVDRLDLAEALSGLTVKQRAIVVLRFVEDRSVADVAGILSIAPGTVKRQSHDALAKLRQRLDTNDQQTAGKEL
jgi:RNA polymerase sigma-70 factor (sigma-E family)